ncbi:fluoride efflux transporter CrcB [Fulvimarina sp. 2208YS6-2-32]|uniref:Fluoride-specific ion channel FluC n=1 Tax=Fulvimarina uroteuthidis TaxID=3098149 RepID=A0ABU5I6D3_9HYPH|nr:fluoride efflux transporter CrcB [Fulvimarina sp. 2208YS6-2-32]MDY8110652.1 fluoride efflux transporter CrcB [Fulvimarina sp. 2208YS6-2-32]
MINLLLVMAGGGLGAGMRHLSNLAAVRFFGSGFPWGTAFVNVFGSFLMGVLVELLARKLGMSQHWRMFLASGCLGGFTTFSSFSLDTMNLIDKGAAGLAIAYVAGSVILGVAALFAGLLSVRALL